MADTKNLTGFKELADALRKLGPRVAKNSLRRAVSAGAAEVRNEARIRVPVRSGTTKRAIAMKREKDTKGETSAKYSVFVRQAKNGKYGQKGVAANGKFDAYYWRFLEFGTSKMAAKPFMRPAFEAKKERAVEVIGEVLGAGIEAAAKELTK
jgi:HK97 gp10 family phage protein